MHALIGQTQAFCSSSKYEMNCQDARVLRALMLVKSDLANTWSMKEISRQVCVSESHFKHLFKDEVGLSFGSYVRQVRLEKAVQLLQTTSAPIKVIATVVGFHDSSHMDRIFRRAYGCPPTVWREERS